MLTGPLRVVCWNVNGIRAISKRGDSVRFLKTSNCDVMCFNETRLQDAHVKEYSDLFSQFPHQYWSCSQARKGYSGVALLSKAPPLDVTFGLNEPLHDQEGRVITAEFHDMFIVTSYIPNSGELLKRLDYRVNEWDVALRSHLRTLKSKGKGVVWIGDLNVVHQEIDIYSLKGNEKHAGCTPEERKSFSKTLDEGFADTFRQLYSAQRAYTWFSYKSRAARNFRLGWRLDYAVVSECLLGRVQDSIIHSSVEGSDHCPIELVLSRT
jgi:exodeoxyribonuclease III